jgi:signal transduction histidine kinase
MEIVFSLVLEAQTVCFSVQDWGLGIPTEDQTHLFESFHRAANVGNIQGTGLGLSVVQRCVELHGGTITVHSQVGEGSTFIAQLPRYCKTNQVASFK